MIGGETSKEGHHLVPKLPWLPCTHQSSGLKHGGLEMVARLDQELEDEQMGQWEPLCARKS